jgi:sortase (surface protein transpeptidase)
VVRVAVGGLERDARHGAIEVPELGRAGWVNVGPRPGEPGRAVIIGHLDTHSGPGLFARVPKLRRGREIAVVDARGGVHRYEVVGSAQVKKRSFPAKAVYGPSRRPVLVLITCGGPYRPGRGYRDNVLVYARGVTARRWLHSLSWLQ